MTICYHVSLHASARNKPEACHIAIIRIIYAQSLRLLHTSHCTYILYTHRPGFVHRYIRSSCILCWRTCTRDVLLYWRTCTRHVLLWTYVYEGRPLMLTYVHEGRPLILTYVPEARPLMDIRARGTSSYSDVYTLRAFPKDPRNSTYKCIYTRIYIICML